MSEFDRSFRPARQQILQIRTSEAAGINVPVEPMQSFSEVSRRLAINDAVALTRQSFMHLPDSEGGGLLEEVRADLEGERDLQRADLTKMTLLSEDSFAFMRTMSIKGISEEQLPQFFTSGSMPHIVAVMLDYPEKFRTQLGIIFSQASLLQMPNDVTDRIQPLQSDANVSLHLQEGWWLCPTSERLLDDAIADEAVMSLGEKEEPYLLIKFNGKLTGLCLQDVMTPQGKVFIRGSWYSPTDSSTRDHLKQAFDEGRGLLPMPEGTWAPMRAYNQGDIESELENASNVARNLPDRYPLHRYGISRRQYREESLEEEGQT